ncbi:hypothetical protein KYC5002_48945 [Archangium violaceum]|uniref:hypothetical protein n=1 Tax=Archangium violaceum TaxID=83451 RepID=UPI002B2EF32A|nr:hypothetical protein KYC5002_48945 [Archangium gephyra]
MVTSLGYGRTGSCAALRAGLTRARELIGFMVPDGDGEEAPARGHPIQGFAEGFFQAGAWVRLASGAMEDLLYEASAETSSPNFWRRTGLIALTPLFDPDRFMWAIDQNPDALPKFFTEPLIKLLGVPIPPEYVQALALGHSGLGEGLRRAEALIGSRQVDRVVLVGADSYLDGLCMQWLAEHGRLKSGEAPTGLLPGQAGACLLVESDIVARARGASSAGQVVGVVVKAAPPDEPLNVTRLGHLLAGAITEVLATAGAARPFRGELVLDLNGEEWKAHVWGNAQVLLAQHVDFGRCRELLPCESLGETGAASGVLGTGLTLSGIQERETPYDMALVCGLSDSGQVAAVLLRGAAREPLALSRS